jgi:poly(3-hydroxybutyrate) depolymerase
MFADLRPRSRVGAFATVCLAIALLGPARAAHASAVMGASAAVCSPSACAAGALSTHPLSNIANDNGTYSNRAYQIYRPTNLTASPTNLAPAYFVFNSAGGCGYSNAGLWQQLAAANRFIVVNMDVPCQRSWDTNTWAKKWIDTASGATTPDDEPYVQAVVRAVRQCPGTCADPQRMYAVGQSSGANMVADMMCDPTTSPMFRGYQIDSSSLQLFGGKPNCPSTNRNYFVMLTLSNYAADQGLYYDTLPSAHFDVNQKGVHFQNWAATRLGCTGAAVVDHMGSTATANTGPGAPAMTIRYRYLAPCAFATSGAAVESLAVINGGHGWPCQDSVAGAFNCPSMSSSPGLDARGAPWTDGLSVEQEFIRFVDSGGSG